MNNDKLFKLLLKCNRNHNNPDLHSFIAKIKQGTVYVECRGYETYIESIVYDKHGGENRIQWVGTTVAAANRLEALGIDFNSIEI